MPKTEHRMASWLGKPLWSVWFRDHIHVDADKKLAVFRTRKEAQTWVKEHGMPECRIHQLTVMVS